MEMKKYELMVIVNSQITQNEIEKRLKEIKELLSEVSFEEIWGIRTFAYPIKGNETGFYAVWNFMKDPNDIHELERTLNLIPDLVRFLVLQVPDDYTPVTLKEIDAGMEEVRKEKADKRSGQRNPRGDRKPEQKEAAPATKAAPAAAVPAPAAAVKEAPAPEKKEEPSTEEKAKKSRSFDQKLEDILSNDDLGL